MGASPQPPLHVLTPAPISKILDLPLYIHIQVIKLVISAIQLALIFYLCTQLNYFFILTYIIFFQGGYPFIHCIFIIRCQCQRMVCGFDCEPVFLFWVIFNSTHFVARLQVNNMLWQVLSPVLVFVKFNIPNTAFEIVSSFPLFHVKIVQ